MPNRECDLLVVGGGPSGLTTAINGASEGLKVCIADCGPELGGQASQSSLIENYPGFPKGVSGAELAARFISQASKFHTDILCPDRIVRLERSGNRLVVGSDNRNEYIARSVVLANGLAYRTLDVPGIGQFLRAGGGVHYGAPSNLPNVKGTVCVVGGANSAGQATMFLSSLEGVNVKVLVRGSIENSMSTYLLERLSRKHNVEILEGVEVTKVGGRARLSSVTLSNGRTIKTNYLVIFIGAIPKTYWLGDTLALDDKGFVRTGSYERPYETSLPGVFAVGDVRLGSVKRVASAVGEGAVVIPQIHDYLKGV